MPCPATEGWGAHEWTVVDWKTLVGSSAHSAIIWKLQLWQTNSRISQEVRYFIWSWSVDYFLNVYYNRCSNCIIWTETNGRYTRRVFSSLPKAQHSIDYDLCHQLTSAHSSTGSWLCKRHRECGWDRLSPEWCQILVRLWTSYPVALPCFQECPTTVEVDIKYQPCKVGQRNTLKGSTEAMNIMMDDLLAYCQTDATWVLWEMNTISAVFVIKCL